MRRVSRWIGLRLCPLKVTVRADCPELTARLGRQVQSPPLSPIRLGTTHMDVTTLMFTSGFDRWLTPLRKLECNHETHAAPAGGVRDDAGEWISRSAAAYPAELNLYLAKALVSLQSDLSSSAESSAIEQPAREPLAPQPARAAPSPQSYVRTRSD